MAASKQNTNYLFDFIYLDRGRVASYYAQLFEDGVLTTLKRTHSTSDIDKQTGSVGLPKILGVSHEQSESAQTAAEGSFDAAWTIPVNVINALSEQGYISDDITKAALGQIVIFSGRLQIIDLRLLQDIWAPLIEVTMQNAISGAKTNAEKKSASERAREGKSIAKIMPHLPHMIQVRMFHGETQLWGTVHPEGMTINPADLAFKHGPSIAGDWKVIAVLDAKPAREEDDDTFQLPMVINDVERGMLEMTVMLRHQFGRPYFDYGITPLAIFRPINAA